MIAIVNCKPGKEGKLTMASPSQRFIRYRTSTEILHCIDDIDADESIPSANSTWIWNGKSYKVLKTDKIGGGTKNQIPCFEVFVEELAKHPLKQS